MQSKLLHNNVRGNVINYEMRKFNTSFKAIKEENLIFIYQDGIIK